MKRFALLALLLPAIALAQEFVLQPGQADTQGILMSRSELGRYFWSDGSGSNSAVDPCTSFSADLTSPSFCLRGDGTSTGSLALSAVGSPTTQTMPWCENGLSCGSVSRQLVSASAYFQTAVMSQPSGSFWGCVRGINDAPMALARYMAQSSSWAIRVSAAGQLFFDVGGGTNVSSSAGAIVGGASQMPCIWWHQVAAGSNVATLYLDGVQVGQNSTEPNLSAISTQINVGQGSGGSISRLGFAMFGTGDPSSTLFARLAAATAPTPQGTRGEAVSTTRASASWVSASDGSLTVLQPNRLGVSGGAAAANARTNLLLQTEAFDNVAWTTGAGGTVSVTANSTVAPDGAQTADTLNATGAGGVPNFIRSASITANGGAYVVSAWGKQGTSSAGVLRLWDATSSTQLCITSAAAASTLTRLSCSAASTTSGHSIQAIIYPADIASNATGSSTWFGAQLETGSVASPYCRSEGTSSTCAGDQVTVPTPSGLSTATGCAKVCVTPQWTGTYPGSGTVYFLGFTAGMRIDTASGLGTIRLSDGTHVASVAANWTAGTKSCAVASWSGSTMTITSGGASSGAVSYTPPGSFGATIQIGGSGSGQQPNGATISDIQLGASAGSCQ